MFHSLMLATVLFFAAPKGGDAALVGTWALAGHNFVTFKADGTGKMEDEAISWSSDGKVITIKDPSGGGETDQMQYQLQDGQLQLVAGGTPLSLTRVGKAAKADPARDEDKPVKTAKAPKEPKETAEPKAAGTTGKAGGKDDLAKLLLSSAWCTFHFNKVSGATSSSRYVYTADGRWAKAARSETYSSGSAGSVAGQYDSGDAGQWKTEKNQLYLLSKDTGGQWYGPVPMTVTRNSSGSPIITSNGTEYASCP